MDHPLAGRRHQADQVSGETGVRTALRLRIRQDGVGERERPRARGVQVAADRPRSFVVIRVRRQLRTREVDAPAIEQLAPIRDRDKHRRVPVLRHADRRCSPHSSSTHAILPSPEAVTESNLARRQARLPSTPERRSKDSLLAIDSGAAHGRSKAWRCKAEWFRSVACCGLT
jgi:hypothetical protein